MNSFQLNDGATALAGAVHPSAHAAEGRRPLPDVGGLYRAGEVRVLILDDDPSVCNLMHAALAPNGFKIDVVSDPVEIEAALRGSPYHVVIMDYVIPGVDSGRMLDSLREFQADASVIVVTAYPSVDSALNCLRARTYDYLTKPFQIAQLQRTVVRCLESKGLLRISESALRESLGAAIRERRKTLGLTLAQMAQRTGVSLGNAIRERRKALGLTLAQMAQRTNVSLGYLSQIELGKNSASIETLYRISLGLGIKMSDLFQSIQTQP